jgi:hypothetical protein
MLLPDWAYSLRRIASLGRSFIAFASCQTGANLIFIRELKIDQMYQRLRFVVGCDGFRPHVRRGTWRPAEMDRRAGI